MERVVMRFFFCAVRIKLVSFILERELVRIKLNHWTEVDD